MTGAPPFETACEVCVLHMEHHSLVCLVAVLYCCDILASRRLLVHHSMLLAYLRQYDPKRYMHVVGRNPLSRDETLFIDYAQHMIWNICP